MWKIGERGEVSYMAGPVRGELRGPGGSRPCRGRPRATHLERWYKVALSLQVEERSTSSQVNGLTYIVVSQSNVSSDRALAMRLTFMIGIFDRGKLLRTRGEGVWYWNGLSVWRDSRNCGVVAGLHGGVGAVDLTAGANECE